MAKKKSKKTQTKKTQSSWKHITVYESSLCQGAFHDGQGWLQFAEFLEMAANVAGLVAKRRKGYNSTWWDLKQKDNTNAHPSLVQIVSFYRALEQAVESLGGTVEKQFDSKMMEEQDEKLAGGPAQAAIPDILVLDAGYKLYEERDRLTRLRQAVDEKRKELEQAQGELECAAKQQEERADFLNKHNSEVSEDWRVEAGLELE